jgi:alpha-tubulin suppressor-like RCC1 family protein
VTWGDIKFGGETPKEIKAKSVRNIYSNDSAFVAVLKNGEVVAWGKRFFGGEIPDLTKTKIKDYKGVKQIYSTTGAFAAVLNDKGIVVTWGNKQYGGVIPKETQEKLVGKKEWPNNVVKIYSNKHAFAAVVKSGEVVTWGASLSGGNNESLYSVKEGLCSQKTKGGV